MATRKAHARWEGSIKDGKGPVDFGNGAFKDAYSFNSRFEDGKGTNPEELLGAAHASCLPSPAPRLPSTRNSRSRAGDEASN